MSITDKVRYIRITDKVRYTRNTDFVYNGQKKRWSQLVRYTRGLLYFHLHYTVKYVLAASYMMYDMGGEPFTCPYPLNVQARLPRDNRPALQSRVSGQVYDIPVCYVSDKYYIILNHDLREAYSFVDWLHFYIPFIARE